jgi:hypothetical protein
MKIAILFSGRIRKYDEHYENIMRQIVQNNEVEFFLSHSPELKEEDLEKFKELYKPVKIVNEEMDFSTDYSKLKLHELTNMNHFLSMWCNRKRVFLSLVEHCRDTNNMYDFVFSIRLDAYNEEPLLFQQIMEEYKFKENKTNIENTVFVPNGWDWGGLNDQLAFGDIFSMETYMSLYDEIWELMKEQPRFGPETILLGYLIKKNIHIHRFNFQYKLKNGKMFN